MDTTLPNKIPLIISTIAISISLYILISTTSTCSRWQSKAINNYNYSILSQQTPTHQPEQWWTDNPLNIATSLWAKDPINLISLLISAIPPTISLIRRKND